MRAAFNKAKGSDHKKKYSIRSFYLESAILKSLEQRSKDSGETINALVNKMLNEMERRSQIKDYEHIITIPDHLFLFLLGMAGEAVINYAKEKGKTVFKEILMRSNAQRSLSIFRKYLKEAYCEQCNWAKYSERVFEDRLIVTLTHGRGHIWSKFMKNYFCSWLAEIIDPRYIPEDAFLLTDTGLLISLPKSLVDFELG